MARRHRRAVAFALLGLAVLLLVAACGSSSPPAQSSSRDAGKHLDLQSAAASPQVAQQSASARFPGAAGSANASAGASPDGSGSSTSPAPTASETPAQYAAGTTPAPATATLSSSCVQPGHMETLHLHAPPSYQVAYNTQYSDGGDGNSYGGSGQGEVSGDGSFTASWIVAPTAPAGRAIVWIAVASGDSSAFRQPEFTVASSC